MNLQSLQINSISRVIAHTINPKTSSTDAYADYLDDLLTFSPEENSILKDRLEEALTNSKKTFKLEFEDYSEKSIYHNLKNSTPFSDLAFIDYSKNLAGKLADSHFRTKIPGGYCLIGEGLTITNIEFFFVIKAELQEVFSIKGNSLQIIKDVFLSPAKDFYKIGFFINDSGKYLPFMYDDQFSPQKKDLTEYFYSKFLGLTTDRNDRILSKNFYSDTKAFIEDNISNVKDRLGLLKALSVLYREETSGLISPIEFSEKYFEKELKEKFDKLVKTKYPVSFTKDISLIENNLELKRITIPLIYSINIIGDSISLENIDIIDNPNQDTMKKLELEINSGNIKKMVLLKEKKDED